MRKMRGLQSVELTRRPAIRSYDAVVGKKEGEGPLSPYFRHVVEDELFGESSFEGAERHFFETAVRLALRRGGLHPTDVRYLLGGDLLNQIISAGFAARSLHIPFLGLYGACSTMAESLAIGSILVDGGYADTVACAVSSHFSAAERQYRFPLELGNQRTPTAQWTVTGAGCTVLSDEGEGLCVSGLTIGTVRDYGVTDANNMGAAMAPAAADVLLRHFFDFDRGPEAYDLILTGDLGSVGQKLTRRILLEAGIDLGPNYVDGGCLIYDPATQDVHAGGSGCGCSAVVLNGCILDKMVRGEYDRILFCATGALLSPTTTLQGESIPAIAHAVVIERRR